MGSLQVVKHICDLCDKVFDSEDQEYYPPGWNQFKYILPDNVRTFHALACQECMRRLNDIAFRDDITPAQRFIFLGKL